MDGDRYIPLYVRLEQDLLRKIREGELPAGASIPSEAELAKQYGISRVTVRHALARLRYEGLIESLRGRGTFVARPKVAHPLDTIRSFEEKMAMQGIVVDHKLLAFEAVVPTLEVRARLGLEPGERVYHIERVRIVEGKGFGLESHFVPENIGGKLDPTRVGDAPVLRLVEEVLGRPARRMKISIACGVTSKDEAAKLGVKVGSPVVVREHVFLAGDGRAVLCGHNIFTDRYQIMLELEEREGEVIAHEWHPTMRPPERALHRMRSPGPEQRGESLPRGREGR